MLTVSEPARISYTIADAARLVGISPRTLQREIEDGQLTSIKIRGRRLVKHRDLEAYMDRLSGGDISTTQLAD